MKFPRTHVCKYCELIDKGNEGLDIEYDVSGEAHYDLFISFFKKAPPNISGMKLLGVITTMIPNQQTNQMIDLKDIVNQRTKNYEYGKFRY